MGEPSSSIPRSARVLAWVLVFFGGVLLLTGLGHEEPLGTVAFVGGTMFVWTVLLPRLSVLRPVGGFVASHALAAGAFWGVFSGNGPWSVVVGSYDEHARSSLVTLAVAVGASVLALALGSRAGRQVHRGDPGTRRALTVGTTVLLLLTPVAVAIAHGEAPMSFQRLRAVPVVASLDAAQRTGSAPLALVRAAGGSFVVGRPDDLESMLAGGPATARGPGTCASIPAGTGIEVRRLGTLLVYTARHAFDLDVRVMGCVYDERSLAPTVLTGADLEHPVGADVRLAAIVVAALAVAFVHLLLAALARGRRGRLARAVEALADGSGLATLVSGPTVRCDAAAGPVMVDVGRAPEAYRDPAIAPCRVVARGTRTEHEEALHREECLAWIGAIATIGAALLPLVGALVAGEVVPL